MCDWWRKSTTGPLRVVGTRVCSCRRSFGGLLLLRGPAAACPPPNASVALASGAPAISVCPRRLTAASRSRRPSASGRSRGCSTRHEVFQLFGEAGHLLTPDVRIMAALYLGHLRLRIQHLLQRTDQVLPRTRESAYNVQYSTAPKGRQVERLERRISIGVETAMKE